MDCIFCKIAAGELPAHKVYEDRRVLAFLDIQPGTTGHTLVIPKAHAETFFDLEDADRDAVFAAARRIGEALRVETGAEGLNLHQSNGSAAGQVIFHFHLHLLPRWQDDGLRSPWRAGETRSEELAELAARLAAGLAG